MEDIFCCGLFNMWEIDKYNWKLRCRMISVVIDRVFGVLRKRILKRIVMVKGDCLVGIGNI